MLLLIFIKWLAGYISPSYLLRLRLRLFHLSATSRCFKWCIKEWRRGHLWKHHGDSTSEVLVLFRAAAPGWERSGCVGGGGKWSSKVKLPNAEAPEPALVSLCCSSHLEGEQQRSEWDAASLCACPASRPAPVCAAHLRLQTGEHPQMLLLLHTSYPNTLPPTPAPRYLKKVLIRDGQRTNLY